MPNESSQIHVIGIDASFIESFFEAKKGGNAKMQNIFRDLLPPFSISNGVFMEPQEAFRSRYEGYYVSVVPI